MASSLQRRIEDLEVQVAAVSDGDGCGWDPLTVEVEVGAGDDEDALVDEAIATALAAREAAGRPIVSLSNGINTIIVHKQKGDLQ